MLEVLKQKVEAKFGKSIQSATDCKELSEDIFEQTREVVSYNTLRRFFGLVDTRSPRISTLDILSKYVGEPDFNHILSLSFEQDEWTNQMEITRIIHDEQHKDVNSLFSAIESLQSKEVVLANTLRELLLSKQIDNFLRLLVEAFSSTSFNSYEHKLFIGNTVGIVFKHINLSDEYLKKCSANPFFQEFILSIYVDYSSLNGWYGQSLKFTKECSVFFSPSFAVFSKCIQEWTNFLNRSEMDVCAVKQMQFDVSFHPILNSRICALKLLCEPSKIPQTISNYSQFLAQNKSDHLFDSYYEVFLVSVFLSDTYLFNLLSVVRLKLKPSSIYHAQHQQVAYLSALFAALSSQDKALCDQLKSSIRPHLFRTSYKEFMIVLLSAFSSDFIDTSSSMSYPFLVSWLTEKKSEFSALSF